ncbi:hypothetical protein JCM11641_000183 [Rhodosporidiobolus odoratus]
MLLAGEEVRARLFRKHPPVPRAPVLTLQAASPIKIRPCSPRPPSKPSPGLHRDLFTLDTPSSRILLNYLTPVLPPAYANVAHILLVNRVPFWPRDFEAVYQIYGGWEDALDACILGYSLEASGGGRLELTEEEEWAFFQFCTFPALRRLALGLGRGSRRAVDRRAIEDYLPQNLPRLAHGPNISLDGQITSFDSFLKEMRETVTIQHLPPTCYIGLPFPLHRLTRWGTRVRSRLISHSVHRPFSLDVHKPVRLVAKVSAATRPRDGTTQAVVETLSLAWRPRAWSHTPSSSEENSEEE